VILKINSGGKGSHALSPAQIKSLTSQDDIFSAISVLENNLAKVKIVSVICLQVRQDDISIKLKEAAISSQKREIKDLEQQLLITKLDVA
jgi:hypothetical protein